MTPLRITRCRKLYIAEHRLHHGLAGVALVILGLVLCAHDRHDWPWPLIDR